MGPVGPGGSISLPVFNPTVNLSAIGRNRKYDRRYCRPSRHGRVRCAQPHRIAKLFYRGMFRDFNAFISGDSITGVSLRTPPRAALRGSGSEEGRRKYGGDLHKLYKTYYTKIKDMFNKMICMEQFCHGVPSMSPRGPKRGPKPLLL